jgi:hypothetical protein
MGSCLLLYLLTPIVIFASLTKLAGVLQAQPLIAASRTNRQFMDIGCYIGLFLAAIAAFIFGIFGILTESVSYVVALAILCLLAVIFLKEPEQESD